MKKIRQGSYANVIDKKFVRTNYDEYFMGLPDRIPERYHYSPGVYPEYGQRYRVLYIDSSNYLYIITNDYSQVFIVKRDGLVHSDDYTPDMNKGIEEVEKSQEGQENNEGANKMIEEKLEKGLQRIEEVLSKRTDFENAMIEGIIEKGKELSVEDIKKSLKEDLDKYIEENYGVLPKKIIFEDNEIKREGTGLYHHKFEDICKIIKKDIPLMLTGPAGAGKNHTVEQVAEVLGLDFYFTNSITQEYKLTGFIDANGEYHETEFYKAFTNGGIFFLDEVDASVPEALIILNSAIANRYFDFPIGRVVANENFRVVCAGNTYGTGADMIYVGRNVLDGATLDRFVCIDFDYDEEIEKSLSHDAEQYYFIKELRRVINENSLRYIVSMRAIINSTKMLEIGFDKATILKQAIIKNMQIDDLNIIINKFDDTNNEWYKELRKLCD